MSDKISKAEIVDFIKIIDDEGSFGFAARALQQLLDENKKLKRELKFAQRNVEISKQVNQTALADAKHHKRAGIAIAKKLHDQHWCACQVLE